MRKAKVTDLDAIIKLVKENFSFAWETTGRKFHAKFFRNKMLKAIKKDIFLVEEHKNELIAFGWASKEKDYFGNPIGEINLLVVKKEYQGKGIGSKMLKTLETKLKTKDLRLECLCINPAHKLYKQKGYNEFWITYRKIF
ncbi:Acetyltransferase (GNAT) family protein [uncultured archaeon]|nr:Acetyltransferase (GNAT) family protein [uncultured archaeon]